MITKYLHLEQVTFDMIYKQRKNQGRKKIFYLRNSLSCIYVGIKRSTYQIIKQIHIEIKYIIHEK